MRQYPTSIRGVNELPKRSFLTPCTETIRNVNQELHVHPPEPPPERPVFSNPVVFPSIGRGRVRRIRGLVGDWAGDPHGRHILLLLLQVSWMSWMSSLYVVSGTFSSCRVLAGVSCQAVKNAPLGLLRVQRWNQER